MTEEQRYISRIIFKNKVLSYRGQKFEDLFVEVMTKSNNDFRAVKAYGSLGDKKNDGFIKASGTYYQVFAPEQLAKDKTIYDAVNKLENDFRGLVNHWDPICKIKKFYFVINDKYEGVPPLIHEKVIFLNNQDEFTDIEICLFTAKDLENVFNSLNDDNVIDIVGLVPSQDIPLIEYDALQETVNYLMSIDVDYSGEDDLIVPDFDAKIKFNELSPKVYNLLVSGSYQEGVLINYFNENPGCNILLQKKFHALYLKAKNEISDVEENYADRRYFFILFEASNYSKKYSIMTCIQVLMAHYFMSCDIFEKPQ